MIAPPAKFTAPGSPRPALGSYLQLVRPANVVTALADVLAGFAAAGLSNPAALPWLLLATAGLYGGGVVFNDVFDAKLDAVERPERPIPSGRATRSGAAALGAALLAVGVGAAFAASAASAGLALLIAACALLYDARAKHHPVLGPVAMGTCRGLNLLLGVSVLPSVLMERWYLALIPIAYIAAITAVSAGEVHGGTRRTALLALALLGAVAAALLALTATPGFALLPLLPFLGFWAWRVLPPFWRACREPAPGPIRGAVMAGVLSLIVLDAALAAGFAGPIYGAAVLALLPLSRLLGRQFAVT